MAFFEHAREAGRGVVGHGLGHGSVGCLSSIVGVGCVGVGLGDGDFEMLNFCQSGINLVLGLNCWSQYRTSFY